MPPADINEIPETMPETMNAVEIVEPGGPEVLVLAKRPVPTPKDGELLVKVAAAGINRPDVLQRIGGYSPPLGVTDIPGLEIAGTVVKVGANAGTWKVGDDLCALLAGGGYAEYAVVPAPQALPIPNGLSMVEAAALPETFFTVWTNVFDRARLKSGETFLVHGGSSGIGTTAIQMARVMGATVFATAGSTEKCAACIDLGASHAINYKSEDFVEVVNSKTDGGGVDVILDMVAGDYIPRDFECLAVEGRIVIIAFLGGSKAEISFGGLMVKRQSLMGSTLRPQSVEAKGRIAEALLKNIWPHIETGAIKPVIDSTFPLNDAAKAHTRIDSADHIGKIVLTN
jgi:putative PIG3 family NAD(P)H quinone oxidoreductase